MLDLTVAMLRLFSAFLLLLIQDSVPAITSPQAGATLRGQVQIMGSMAPSDFSSAELSFSYDLKNGSASDSADNWFTIQTFSQPITDSVLAVWDTTTLTDDDYALRLRLFLQDGSFQDALVTGLKIRNDLPEPTATPTGTESSFPQFDSTSQPVIVKLSPTPEIVYPLPTPLPLNPAAVETNSIYRTFSRGALIVLGLFIFISLILRLRKPT